MRLMALASRYVLAVFLVMIGLVTSRVMAAPVTWTYVGSALGTCDVGCPQSTGLLLTDILSLTVTFNGPLTPSLPNANLSSSIISWTMTDTTGFVDLSSTIGSPLGQAVFSTDGAGNIVGPYSFISSNNPLPTSPFNSQPLCLDGSYCIHDFTAYQYIYAVGVRDINSIYGQNASGDPNSAADFIDIYTNPFYQSLSLIGAVYSISDGVWILTPTATPLPTALPLFASGLGVVGILARRRKRKAAALAA